MTCVIGGKGISIMQRTEYVAGQSMQVAEISIDSMPGTIDATTLNSNDTTYAYIEEGHTLVATGFGGVEWRKPFYSDKELREQYPALEGAWDILMEALEEYMMVKKLVQDHDK